MLLDADLLLFAEDQDSPHHDVSRGWLGGALNGPVRVGLPWPALAIEHGVAVCSADTDFARFLEVQWINPLST